MVYSLGPIPSNHVFIAAGLSGSNLTPIVAGFLAGRLVSYPALAFTARGVTGRLDALLTNGWRDSKAIALELLSIVGVVLFARIDWPRVLHLPVPSVRSAAPAAASTSPGGKATS